MGHDWNSVHHDDEVGLKAKKQLEKEIHCLGKDGDLANIYKLLALPETGVLAYLLLHREPAPDGGRVAVSTAKGALHNQTTSILM